MGICPANWGGVEVSGGTGGQRGTCLLAPQPTFSTSQVLHCELEAVCGLVNNGCKWVLKNIRHHVVVSYY